MSQPNVARSRASESHLPDDAALIGYNGDVGFYLSKSLGLVFIVQAGVVWTLPRVREAPRAAR